MGFLDIEKTEYNVLSLGAGVQSSCLALMAAHGEFGGVDAAIFSDTMAEPKSVMDWLEKLKGLIAEAPHPFPVHVVSKGDLTADLLEVRNRRDGSGTRVNNSIPLFGLKPSGEVAGAVGRSCTVDYKIRPVHKKLRELCGIKRGESEVKVTQWIGISTNEIQRMKDPRVKWIQNRWPLIESRMSRRDCFEWIADHGYPEPPRSACYYCPFHDDNEWRRMRDNEPEEFAKAIQFDKDIREVNKKHNKRFKMEVFLHRSCKPLVEVDFDTDEDKGQLGWDFQSECEGMCGI